MIPMNEFDLGLYERMAGELRQVAADLRTRQSDHSGNRSRAQRLEAYASAINTNLPVELA